MSISREIGVLGKEGRIIIEMLMERNLDLGKEWGGELLRK